MARQKYMLGQVFTTKVNQEVHLRNSSGALVPFVRKSRQRVDIPAGSKVVLVADYHDDLGKGKHRTYVLRVDGTPIYFADHVLSRKYDLVLEEGSVPEAIDTDPLDGEDGDDADDSQDDA